MKMMQKNGGFINFEENEEPTLGEEGEHRQSKNNSSENPTLQYT